MGEFLRAAEAGGFLRCAARKAVSVSVLERLAWHVNFQVEKWHREEEFLAGAPPDETLRDSGNILLNAGINRLEDLLIGAGGQALDNTHCRIGAGDGTTAVAATDTDLSAAAGSTHRWFQVMDATYPSRSSQTITFKATFGTGDGNFTWNEWGIDAGTASGNTVTAPLLNRKIASLGTKTAGATWAFTVTLTIS
jgi:hypothetical protein